MFLRVFQSTDAYLYSCNSDETIKIKREKALTKYKC